MLEWMKRILVILVLVVAYESPFCQIILICLLDLILTIFKIFKLPMKSKFENVKDIIQEFFNFSCVSLMFLYRNEVSADKNKVTLAIIGMIAVSIALCIVPSYYSILRRFLKWLKILRATRRSQRQRFRIGNGMVKKDPKLKYQL